MREIRINAPPTEPMAQLTLTGPPEAVCPFCLAALRVGQRACIVCGQKVLWKTVKGESLNA